MIFYKIKDFLDIIFFKKKMIFYKIKDFLDIFSLKKKMIFYKIKDFLDIIFFKKENDFLIKIIKEKFSFIVTMWWIFILTLP